MCSFHYGRVNRGADPLAPRRPSGPGRGDVKMCACGKISAVGPYCRPCYNRMTKMGLPINGSERAAECIFAGCRSLVRDSLNHGLCKLHYHTTWRFSISVEKLVELSQNLVCGNAGCGAVESLGKRKHLHLDHDHRCCPPGKFGTSSKMSCGKCIRGWLCSTCNSALGMLQENPRKIQGLLDYVNNF